MSKHAVLIVDDNVDAANVLALGVRAFGHEAQTASSGAEALELVTSYYFDIAFLDLGMPEMDGFELARQLRRTIADRRPYLVALTGWGGLRERAETKAAGFDEHWTKPADLNSLGALLARPVRD